jgi:hypothetical protein
MNAHTKVEPDTFAQAFVKLQAAIKPAIKDATNPAFRSKYADLGAVWDAVKEPLREHGFAIIQMPQFEGDTMFLETIVLHAGGEKMVGRYPLRPVKNDPQGYGSAITYARRYSVCAMLGVIADEDDDGNAASGRANGSAPAKPQDTEMDREVQDGANDWAKRQANIIAMANRLPDLLMSLDEHGGDWAKPQSGSTLDRLKRKAPEAFKYLKQCYQGAQDAISKKEIA